MKRRLLLSIAGMLAASAVSAQTETKPLRFELSVESGLSSIISGPNIEDMSNFAGRFGFMPSENFQLTLLYEKLDGTLARNDDPLGGRFIAKYRRTVNSRTSFREALLDKRDVEYEQIELGIVKTIPLGGKKWESYMGIGVGSQKSTADVTWSGATRQGQPVTPALSDSANNEFFTSVRGGVRYVPLRWIAVQVNLRLVPIGKVLGEDYNSIELNGGLVFRFGSF